MSRRKLSERKIRKLFRTGRGGTMGVTLPIEDIRKAGWREKQKVVVEYDDKKKEFRIKDWKKK